MKTITVVLLALAPAMAQIHPVGAAGMPATSGAAKISAPPASLTAGKPSPISLASLNALQHGFDDALGSFDINDPIDILGRTRGIYLKDYGVVFTTELSPIVTPGITPFHQTITEQEKAKTRQRKLDRIPLVVKLMRDMMKNSAAQLSTLPDGQQVVVMVKLLYLPWENTQGLPGQIVMKGDKRSALNGTFTPEVE